MKKEIFALIFFFNTTMVFCQTVWPVPTVNSVSGAFGEYRPLSKPHLHGGIDIPGGLSTPVFAAAPGTITARGFSTSYGSFVEIQVSNNLYLYYAHGMTTDATPPTTPTPSVTPLPQIGDIVSPGEVVNHIGNTGTEKGIELHFELRDGAYTGSFDRLNPLSYLPLTVTPTPPAFENTNPYVFMPVSTSSWVIPQSTPTPIIILHMVNQLFFQHRRLMYYQVILMD